MDKDELHAAAQLIHTDAIRKMYLHALIDLGLVVEIKCAHPECLHPETGFSTNKSEKMRHGLTFDHIEPRCNNGSHLPNNVRIVHAACNRLTGSLAGAKTRAAYSDPLRHSALIQKQRINGAKGLEVRWAKPGARERQSAAMKRAIHRKRAVTYSDKNFDSTEVLVIKG